MNNEDLDRKIHDTKHRMTELYKIGKEAMEKMDTILGQMFLDRQELDKEEKE